MTGLHDQLPLVVVGASGHARVVIDAARQPGRYQIVGLVDTSLKPGTMVDGVEVVGTDDALAALAAEHPGLACVVAIGDNRRREQVMAAIAANHPEIDFAAVVHPAAVVPGGVAVGAGAFIAAGAVINPGARVGEHAIVNTGATIDHDAQIGAFASIGPNAALAGNVNVGRGATIGIAACAIPGTSIGAWAVVGAGAVVIRDVAPGETVVGVPARPLRSPSLPTS